MSNGGDRILQVNEQDIEKMNTLEDLAKNMAGTAVIRDADETIGSNFEKVDESVAAILVRKNSADGAVRIFGREIRNVVTGPQEHGFVLVCVSEGEHCRIFGTPTVRYFRKA
ncbi:hypothetical protein LTR56_026633 [Elasticomyces elasticus]|nr:hypothetical protein LTR56_026633 [Elasticomyces elasticus]KAK4894130.1 hypothetical protein LTR49_028429 [Elasticomyces elasticus]KAK5736672.1 hypothetical protein LTS12_026111 [Elasticomyces elasticus]